MDTQDRQKILQALNMAYLYVMDADSPLQRVIDEAVDTLKKYEND